MSEEAPFSKGLSRRGFLKLAGVTGAVGAAGAAGMVSTSGWLKPAGADGNSDDRVAHTFHQCHCGGHCSFSCTVRDGRLVLIQPNTSWEDKKYATVCLKGLSEVNHVYSEERIQTPLKRVGERGANEFESITWDEALDTLVSKVSEIKKKYGGNAMLTSSAVEPVYGGTGMLGWISLLFGTQTGGLEGIDTGIGNGFEPAIGGYGTGLGYSANEPADWVNSKNVILIGSNMLESVLVQSTHFFNAKEAGCYFTVVDPNFSTTACKADEWLPINPGTDAALILGMTSAVLDNGWADEGFMRKYTSMPFLVDVKSGKVLKVSKAIKGEDGEGATQDRCYVWDTASKQKKFHDQCGKTAALEGTFKIDGRTYTTVYELVKKAQKQYTAEWAADITGIDADKIVALAKRYATGGPACLGWGVGGGDKYANADVTGHAAAVITALTGQYGKKGASTGFFGDGGLRIESGAELAEWPLPDSLAPAEDEMDAFDLRVKKNNVHGVICLGDPIQQHFADYNKTLKWLSSLDFIAVIDICFGSTSAYADLILPVCSKFEADEDIESIKSCYNHVLLREKVIDPLFESKTDFTLQKDIAKRLGVDKYLPASAEELARYALEKSDDPKVAGMTLAKLKENGGILPHADAKDIHRAFTNMAMPTPSGRFEVYYEDMLEYGQQLPHYEKPNEVYEGNELAQKYPLQFSQPRTRFHLHNQFCDSKWIQELYSPYAELNPQDMESRGLSDGDEVRIVNDRGELKCPVRANAAVRPGTSRMYEGSWTKYTDEGNVQNLTNDTMNERGYAQFSGPVIPYNDTLVQIEKA